MENKCLKSLLTISLSSAIALGIATQTATVFAAMPSGTVMIGDYAYSLDYANNIANESEISEAVANGGGKIFIKSFDDSWIDNDTAKDIDISSIKAVTYKDAKGVVTKYKEKDGDAIVAEATTYKSSEATLAALKFDNTKWQYDATNKAYWQIGISYCASPEAKQYESMGIYVPAEYMTAKDNGDGTFTCTVNDKGTVGTYTATTAPMVIPVNTPGYAASPAPTSFNYTSVASYLKEGFIYLQAGCRGNGGSKVPASTTATTTTTTTTTTAAQNTAPWGVTDLKAAIRYVRLNASDLPGDSKKIFSFGMSGGGAQSALLGSTGDSELYYSYLNKINAALTDAKGNPISDAIDGSMCWCPITSLDVADEAYEWMLGQYTSTGTRADGTFTSVLSKDLANSFATSLNNLALTDSNGKALTLTKSSTGVYTSGTYYDYIKSTIETSLNNFLADTKFPYTPTSSKGGPGGPGGPGAGPGFGPGGAPTGTPPTGAPTGTPPTGTQSSQASVTYNSVEEYIASLNGSENWISYDSKTNTATITNISGFIKNCKTASKDVGAFDGFTLTGKIAAENEVFGDATNTPQHFDATLANLLEQNQTTYAKYSGWDPSYVSSYAQYATVKDELGTSSLVRQNMYNPMYYINKSYSGYGTSKVAPYWRIRTGIFQGDTSLTTEANLALALQSYGVKDVDFATVWGQYHTMAERTGNSTDNFIDWVNQCCAK